MSMSLTGSALVTRALQTCGITGQGETPSPADLIDGFNLLNELVDSWAIQALTIPTVNSTLYTLVAGQGGPDNPYTLGPGGDWDTGTAQRPPSIQDANLILNNSSPYVRIPLAIVTTTMSANQSIPLLTNSLPVTLYYNDTVPLGQVVLWPIPTDAANQIELWTPVVMAQFRTPTTVYVCPPGYLKAFRLNLAAAMVTMWAVPPAIASFIVSEAREALSDLKASNVEMSDLALDPAYTPNTHGSYCIQTDTGA